MDEPWQIYYEELLERGEEITEHEFNRADDMAEAAHETYEAVADRLVNQLDYDEGEALMLTKAFNRAVKEWIAGDGWEWDDLRARLEEKQLDWEQSAEVG